MRHACEVDSGGRRASVAEMRRLAAGSHGSSAVLAMCLPALCWLVLAGCATPGTGEMLVDVMFRKTGAPTEGVVELTTPALVNEINGAYSIEAVSWYAGAALAEDGKVTRGDNRVFLLEFMDRGDISLLQTDDKRVSLRAELAGDGTVRTAILGSVTGTVVSGFTAAGNDTFESGSWELVYDGPDLVVGRIDLKFKKYRVAGNFRAPRSR